MLRRDQGRQGGPRTSRRPKDAELRFRNVFTDHMFVADSREDEGLVRFRGSSPNGLLPLDPAAAVLQLTPRPSSMAQGLPGCRWQGSSFRPQEGTSSASTTPAKHMVHPPAGPGLALDRRGPCVAI